MDHTTNKRHYGDSAQRCLNSMDIEYPIRQNHSNTNTPNTPNNSDIDIDSPYEVDWDSMDGFLDYGLNKVIGNHFTGSNSNRSGSRNRNKGGDNGNKITNKTSNNEEDGQKEQQEVQGQEQFEEQVSTMYSLSDYALMFTESHFNSLSQKQKVCMWDCICMCFSG